MRSAVVALGLPDPAQTRDELEAAAGGRGAEGDLIHGLAEVLEPLGGAATARDILARLARAGDAYPLLRSALEDAFPNLPSGVLPSADRDHFFPGLKPRGHESVLYPTTRELVAALPRPAEKPPDEARSHGMRRPPARRPGRIRGLVGRPGHLPPDPRLPRDGRPARPHRTGEAPAPQARGDREESEMRKPASRRLKSIARLRALLRTSRRHLDAALARRSAAIGGEPADYGPLFDHLDAELDAAERHLATTEDAYEVHPRALAARLEPRLGRLEDLCDALIALRASTAASCEQADRALATAGRTVSCVAGSLEGLCRLAGMDGLAGGIRRCAR